MAVFRLFKLASILHVGFLKFKILTVDRAEGQPVSPCQILWRLVKLLPRYGDFSFFFQNADHPLSWIIDTCVWTTHEEYLVAI